MSGNRFVVDTNIISYFLQGERKLLTYFNFNTIYISFITEMELLSIPNTSESEIERIQNFIDTCQITDINSSIKEKAIQIKRDFKLKLPDALIAATAQYLGYPLLTSDKIFRKIQLPVIFYQH